MFKFNFIGKLNFIFNFFQEHRQKNTARGGDGGKIFLIGNVTQGNGKILADGGDGLVGGTGGEIHIVANKNEFTGEISAEGGRSITNYL